MQRLRNSIPWLLALSAAAACNGEEGASSGFSVPPTVSFGGGGIVGGVGFGPDAGAPPRVETLRSAAKTPPTISGGTLAVDGAGTVAVVADSDRDQIYVIDLKEAGVRKVKLPSGSEPGRVALEGTEAAHVALRGSGRLVRVELATGNLSKETDVCSHPRGVAFDSARGRVVVACLDGQLVQLEAATHTELARKSDLPDDLRDVLVGENGVEVVSRYRSAQLLRLSPALAVKSTATPRKGQRIGDGQFIPPPPPDAGIPTDTSQLSGLLHLSPTLVWRTMRARNGNVWMMHQQSQDEQVVLSTGGGYGSGGCSTITGGRLTEMDSEGNTVRTMSVPLLGLSVDAAISANGKWVAVASPGAFVRQEGTLQVYSTDGMVPVEQIGACQPPSSAEGTESQVTAVAFDDNNVLYSFSRDPAELTIYEQPEANQTFQGGFFGGTAAPIAPPIFVGGSPRLGLKRKATIGLDLVSARDTGHDLFHADVGRGLACASCHGEALDDAHVWNFEKIGARRTQNMRGGFLNTAPFHWDGDMMNMHHLVDEVMTRRMGGFNVAEAYSDALGSWIDRQPALSLPARDKDAVERGKVLFNAASTKCSACHSGDAFTNNKNEDVGTGGSFQVPGLRGLALRGPFMHNGCAKTLEERFVAPCGGGDKHGTTSKLKPNEIADLVAYLKTL